MGLIEKIKRLVLSDKDQFDMQVFNSFMAEVPIIW